MYYFGDDDNENYPYMSKKTKIDLVIIFIMTFVCGGCILFGG